MNIKEFLSKEREYCIEDIDGSGLDAWLAAHDERLLEYIRKEMKENKRNLIAGLPNQQLYAEGWNTALDQVLQALKNEV